MIIKEITTRRSIRKFKPDAVSDEAVLEIIKAAEFAPSGRHIKPIEYVIVREQGIRENMFGMLGDDFILEAPVLIIPIADTQKSTLIMQDISIASGYMFLQAISLGLGTVWKNLNSENTEKLKTMLGIPSNYTMINLIPVGYPAEDQPPHDDGEFDANKIRREKF